MSSKKVTDPNAKNNSGFLWALVAVLVIAVVVIGFIVWQGQSNKTEEFAEYGEEEVAIETEYSDNSVTLAAAEPAADAEEVSLYEDFSCSYCASLAENTDEQMLDEIENGNLIVNIRPLHFLDQGSQGHSTEAMAASLALADNGDTTAYWNMRSYLLENQQGVYNQWDSQQFADAAAGMGASDAAVEAIANGEYIEEATQVGTDNANRLEEAVGEVSSPSVLQDGEPVAVQDINQWIDAVLSN